MTNRSADASATAPRSSVSITLAGSGGAGVMTAGNLLLEAAAAAGYYALMTRTSGPQIRGGEAAAMVRIATHPVDNMEDRFHVLVAIDWQNVNRFAAELPIGTDSLLVGDPDQSPPPEVFVKTGARYAPVQFKKIAKSIAGGWPNMVALGLVATLIGLPDEAVRKAAGRSLKKRPESLAATTAAIAAGAAAAKSIDVHYKLAAPLASKGKRWLITGNEAAGYGAIQGGVRFVAAYPITPATELLEWMSPALTRIGGALVQAEDELASINMAIGASYGGVPSLTATSGPGLSLMVESLGLAVTSETPVVVVDVMRVGPSTGIATKSEQGDLNISMYGMHGDAPHIVVAPNSLADCAVTTQWAVRLAEALQTAAIVLSDQFMGQARAVVDQPGEAPLLPPRQVAEADAPGYKRYANTESGISPMAIPGTPGVTYNADGLEHNERGSPSSQASDHATQLDKRRRKFDAVDYGEHWAEIEGDGDIALVTFGSSTGPVREAYARARADGLAARLVSVRLLSPTQPEKLAQALSGVKRALVVEQNHSGQFYRYLKREYDLDCELTSFRKPGPLPILPDEIHRTLIEWSRA